MFAVCGERAGGLLPGNICSIALLVCAIAALTEEFGGSRLARFARLLYTDSKILEDATVAVGCALLMRAISRGEHLIYYYG